MNKGELAQKLKVFFESKWYAITVAALILLGHSTFYVGDSLLFGGYQGYLFGVPMAISLCIACFVCTDARFIVMPAISILCLMTAEHSPNLPYFSDFYLKPQHFFTIFGMVAVFVGCLVWFIIRNRHTVNAVTWRGSIFSGLVAFAIALSFNGIFSRYYTIGDTVFGFLFSALILLLYIFFALYVKFDRSAFEHFMTCVLALGLLVSAEVFWAYLTGGVRFENGSVVKESVLLGWGIWTAIGGMLIFTLPAAFYFAHSHRHPWIYWLLGATILLATFLSQSRGALLFGGISAILSVLVLCFSGKNKRFNRMFAVAICAVGVLGFVLLFDKLTAVLQNYLTYGFSDNGRYEKWLTGWHNFLSSPVFGAGFYGNFSYSDFDKGVYPYFYHNTLVQMLAAGGIVGIAGYLYHRFTTVRIAVLRPNPEKTYIGLCLLSLMSFCLLDVLFFNAYPTVLYALMILYMEKSDSVQ